MKYIFLSSNFYFGWSKNKFPCKIRPPTTHYIHLPLPRPQLVPSLSAAWELQKLARKLLRERFGNFHLNYVIDTNIFIVFREYKNDELVKLRQEFIDFLRKNNQLPGTKTNKHFVKLEFLMFKQKYRKINDAEVLFINENVYRDFI